MSRLTRSLQAIEARKRALGGDNAVAHHLDAAQGDALEFAARVAAGAFKARDREPDESDVFRVGYATACKELAIVLRAMRAGTHPNPVEMREARKEATLQVMGTDDADEFEKQRASLSPNAPDDFDPNAPREPTNEERHEALLAAPRGPEQKPEGAVGKCMGCQAWLTSVGDGRCEYCLARLGTDDEPMMFLARDS